MVLNHFKIKIGIWKLHQTFIKSLTFLIKRDKFFKLQRILFEKIIEVYYYWKYPLKLPKCHRDSSAFPLIQSLARSAAEGWGKAMMEHAWSGKKQKKHNETFSFLGFFRGWFFFSSGKILRPITATSERDRFSFGEKDSVDLIISATREI